MLISMFLYIYDVYILNGYKCKNSGSWFIVFDVLTFKIVMLAVIFLSE